MKVVSLLFVTLVIIISSCNKDNNPPTQSEKKTRIINVATENITTGMLVTIVGENFGNTVTGVILKLDSTVVQISTISDNEITFIVPANLLTEGYQNYNLLVVVSGANSNVFSITITFAGRGWRYVNKDIDPIEAISAAAMHFFDAGCGIGILVSWDGMALSNDDGMFWSSLSWSDRNKDGLMSVSKQNEIWMAFRGKDIYCRSYLDCQQYFKDDYYAELDTITSIPLTQNRDISGLFIMRKNLGYFLTRDGSLFKVNGSFRANDLTIEYQSTLPDDFYNSQELTGYWQLAGIDSLNMMFGGYPKINNERKPLIIVKRNGIFKEYNLRSLLPLGWPEKTYFVDKDVLFFSAGSFGLFQLDLSTDSWINLHTPNLTNFCFVNKDIIYATDIYKTGVNYRYIYKSIDGGKSWKIDFALDLSHMVHTIFTKNNKVWVIGENTSSNKTFMLKYTP